MSRRGPKQGEFEEPKQARTREQLARILEEADRLFAERGYQATKIADIAAAVPCSISTIYDRFGGKAELLRYMHRQGADDAIRLIQEYQPSAASAALGDLRDVLPGALRMGLAILRRYQGRRRASLERIHVDAKLAAVELEIMDSLMSAGQRFLLAYQRQFTHPEPELAAQLAMRLLMAMVEQRESPMPTPRRGTLTEDRFVDEMARLVLGYLGVPPSI